MKNRYGVDVSYHTGKLNQIIRDMDNYTPDELARSLLRLANAADGEVFKEKEFTRPVKVKPLVWVENWAGTPTTCAAGHKVFAVERTFSRIGVESVYYIAGMPIDEIFETEDETKQAAQDHHEKLILESIEL